ncbi:hypothetical protein IV77_GL001178 [Olsenella uli DSM 7084]|nr:hypothetical protein IV77_GL001178 [Olsenella uli DSM 7084]
MCTIPLSLVPWLRHPVALGPLRSKHSACRHAPGRPRRRAWLGSRNGSEVAMARKR